jgi:hypothetical protein
MPRMLAQEHLGYVDAIQFGGAGLARTSATIAAALTSIGARNVILLLSFVADGVWTLNTSIVFPVNVTVSIPPGVVLTGSGNLTFNGQVRAETSAFYTGTGTLTFSPSAPFTFFNQLIATRIGINTTVPILAQLHLSGDVPTPATILVQQRTAGSGNAGIEFWSASSSKGFLGLTNGSTGQDLVLDVRGTGGNLIMGGPGGAKLGINTTTAPQAQLHISGDATLPATLRIEERSPAAGGATVAWWSAGVVRGAMGLPGSQNITLQLSNSAQFIVNGGNVGLGMTPSVQLELSTGGANKLSGTLWVNPSDNRLKTDLGPFLPGIDVLMQVMPRRFTFNGLGGIPASTTEHQGFMAQDVMAVAPYMVESYEGKLNPEDVSTTTLYRLDQSAFVLMLINAIKDHEARLVALETP